MSNKTMTSRFSLLRQGTANELIEGGVWYRKNDDGSFSTVVTLLPKDEAKRIQYKEQIKEDSKNGLVYLREDKPNYPLTQESELFFNDYNRHVKANNVQQDQR